MSRVLDLLRNHPSNVQALITDYTDTDPRDGPWFIVRVEPISGPETGSEKATFHTTRDEAYAHARATLGMEG